MESATGQAINSNVIVVYKIQFILSVFPFLILISISSGFSFLPLRLVLYYEKRECMMKWCRFYGRNLVVWGCFELFNI